MEGEDHRLRAGLAEANHRDKHGRGAGNTIFGDSVAGTVKYAPPEQMGDIKGLRPGHYSDVYSFGKTCCYALFKTTEPKRRHWRKFPTHWPRCWSNALRLN